MADEKLANVLLDAGLTLEARSCFSLAWDARQRLSIENPENMLYAMATAIAVERVAHCSSALGEHESAREAYASAIETARLGIAEVPDDVRLWTVLGVAQKGMGQSFLDAEDGDLAEARRCFEQSLATLESMCDLDMKPTRSTLHEDALLSLLKRYDAG